MNSSQNNKTKRTNWRKLKLTVGGRKEEEAGAKNCCVYVHVTTRIWWVNEWVCLSAKLLWKQHEFNYFEIMLTNIKTNTNTKKKWKYTTESIWCRFVFVYFFIFLLLSLRIPFLISILVVMIHFPCCFSSSYRNQTVFDEKVSNRNWTVNNNNNKVMTISRSVSLLHSKSPWACV